MRIFPRIIVSGIASLLVSGCASVVDVVETGADAASPRFCEPARGFGGDDYSKLEAMLSPEMREQMTEERFHAAYANLRKSGTVSNISYITTLRQGVTFSELWKITLVKPDARNEKIIIEKILRIIGATSDGKHLILGIMLQ